MENNGDLAWKPEILRTDILDSIRSAGEKIDNGYLELGILMQKGIPTRYDVTYSLKNPIHGGLIIIGGASLECPGYVEESKEQLKGPRQHAY
jgi:hypothetical protein